MPKRGFSNKRFATEYAEINVAVLERFDANTEITPELLKETGLVKQQKDGIKVLGNGELTKPLTVRVHAISKEPKRK